MKKKQVVPQPDVPTVVTAVVVRGAPLDATRTSAVLRRMADGESLLSATKKEGISRCKLLRRVERDAAFRERFSFAVSARAHTLADSLLEIASGKATADATAHAVVRALEATASPQLRDSVIKSVLALQVQRDRLLFDAHRWLSSRLLPSVYGSAQTASANPNTTIRVVFDALPDPRELPSAEFEVLTDNE